MANIDGSGKHLVDLDNAYVSNQAALRTPHIGAGNVRRQSGFHGIGAGPSTGRRSKKKKTEEQEEQLDPEVLQILLTFLQLQLEKGDDAMRVSTKRDPGNQNACRL